MYLTFSLLSFVFVFVFKRSKARVALCWIPYPVGPSSLHFNGLIEYFLL
jgi:hypothetical protein